MASCSDKGGKGTLVAKKSACFTLAFEIPVALVSKSFLNS